ncbi:M3 family metallopeptidase [Enterobacteriaceae endosymbiont of Donacia semicuprea]|uniref:M3 family metallopeptidase n=1 Tax=Enterobacteriaceae endosymbiont of Donacia semicuprea TaxID=2675783 RepID=UPI00144952DA|nr:M3 family metallopeptidase [Enterobacteriaceae endosymbiont of Donacia semicuprea]QJC32846.1 oligopeptidase A [Enterobacteriaceae endosymbiont of Donacia semicuprea]
MHNPLLSHFLLPPFSKITNNCMIPAIEITISLCKKKIKKILDENKNNYNWQNFCQPILELHEKLYRIFSPISHLNYVCNNKEIRKIYEVITKMIINYNIWIQQNKQLYDAYIQIKNNQNNLNFHKLKIKSINDIIRDFKLSGILLNQEKKKKYSLLVTYLSKLQNNFNNNVFDSTLKWEKNITDKKKLTGVPNYIINIMAKNALQKNKTGYLITLDVPIYLSIITYAKNINLRKKIYYKYNTRASSISSIKLDNEPIIMKELSLRLKLSNLLGYNSYSEQSLITKSAKKINNVLSFLYKLIKLSKKQAKKEVYDLKQFIKKKYNIININPWDITFFSEKYKFYLYGINDNDIRNYFPISSVMKGMFKIVKKIYGLLFKQRKISVWNKNVIFFDVFNSDNKLYGSIYFDLYIRSEKRNGAWMDICQTKMLKNDKTLQYPVAYVNCNFTPSTNNIFLLNHNEILTLFHEFGHALHHITSKIEIPNISGINGIPLDIVEFPSQFMEYWCWELKSLKILSSHYQNNDNLPINIMNKLISSKKYNAALSLMRQIELSLFDIKIHNEFNPKKNHNQILDLIEKIRKNLITIIPIPKWNKYTNVFNHIFGGEYAAGYYSYLWSEQLAADSFFYFKKNGLFNPIIGKKFLDNLLSLGSSQDPIILFEKFRGRKLNSNALLLQRGIKI